MSQWHHGYTEQSARNKLARHRKRGDLEARAFYCLTCETWHVTSPTNE